MIEKYFGAYAGIVKLILAILGIALVGVIIFVIYKAIEKARINKIIDNTSATANVNGVPVQVNIGTKASEIYDALHGSWYSEDEVKAVNAVLSVPKALIPQLSSTYNAISGENLKTDLQYYLNDNQWLSIAHQFN